MNIRRYEEKDAAIVLHLWNTAGTRAGYAPQDMAGLERLLLRHPDFSADHTFLMEDNGTPCGFANGCTGDHLVQGAVRGYVTCVLLDADHDDEENTMALLTALEDSFRQKGKTASAVTFFNPIRLPWIIPDTPGHQHNNMPGIPTDLPLCGRMLNHGYRQAATEMAMYLNLSDFTYPEDMLETEHRMAQDGYTVDWYQEGVHQGVEAMTDALGNPQWREEIPAAAHGGLKLLVGLKGNTVAGFTGPVYPESTGRGYFAGIGVAPAYERHGLGRLLFFKLCQAEKDCGAQYMSLFTGVENHAQTIYRSAGFEPRRCFAVMLKEL